MSNLPFTLCAASMTAVSEDADVCFTQNTMHGLLCDVPLSVPNLNKFTCHVGGVMMLILCV